MSRKFRIVTQENCFFIEEYRGWIFKSWIRLQEEENGNFDLMMFGHHDNKQDIRFNNCLDAIKHIIVLINKKD